MGDNQEKVPGGLPDEVKDCAVDVELNTAFVNVLDKMREAVETIHAKLSRVSMTTKLTKTNQQATNDNLCVLAQLLTALAMIVAMGCAAAGTAVATLHQGGSYDMFVFTFGLLTVLAIAVAALGIRYTCSAMRTRRWTGGDDDDAQ